MDQQLPQISVMFPLQLADRHFTPRATMPRSQSYIGRKVTPIGKLPYIGHLHPQRTGTQYPHPMQFRAQATTGRISAHPTRNPGLILSNTHLQPFQLIQNIPHQFFKPQCRRLTTLHKAQRTRT